MMFQMMFAIITPALISGAVVERMKFSSYIIFLLLWTTLVYDPVAHWVWSGWEETDSTGATVVKFGWLRY
jgi:Amt family ammonium transporter